MAQMRVRDQSTLRSYKSSVLQRLLLQRARPENKNGDPKAAIPCLVKG
jgi:hypothetical protein